MYDRRRAPSAAAGDSEGIAPPHRKNFAPAVFTKAPVWQAEAAKASSFGGKE